MLEQRIAQWEEELVHKGIMLGTERGKAEGIVLGEEKALINQKKTLLEMLSTRFGEFPQEWSEIIFQIPDCASISQLMIGLLTAKNPDDFERLLKTKQ